MRNHWKLLILTLVVVMLAGLLGFSGSKERTRELRAAIAKDVATLGTLLDELNQQLETDMRSSPGGDNASGLSEIASVRDSLKQIGTNPSALQEVGQLLDSLQHRVLDLRSAVVDERLKRAAKLAEVRSLLQRVSIHLTEARSAPRPSELLYWPGVFGDGLLRLLTSWSFVLGLGFLCTLLFPTLYKRVAGLFDGLTSLKVGPSGVELSTAGVRRVSSQADRLVQGLKDYRELVKAECLRLANGHQITERLKSVVTADTVTELLGESDSLRCTIHVADPLFADHFYQLVDYYPVPTNGAGRIWSFRYGFVGRVWRTNKSSVEGNVKELDELVRRWGMTKEEASTAGAGRKSFAGILLKSTEGLEVGLLYMDHEKENAFTKNVDDAIAPDWEKKKDHFIEAVAGQCKTVQLGDKILAIKQSMAEFALRVSIHG